MERAFLVPEMPSLDWVMAVTEGRYCSRVEESPGCEEFLAGNLPNAAQADFWHALERLKSLRHYQQHDFLFRDGELCAGIYLVESGEINLLVSARPKHYRIFDTAGAGSVLGLCEAMSGSAHKLTAEAAGPVDVSYIERMALMKYLSTHCEVCMQVVALLSEDLHALYRRCRTLTPLDAKPRKKTVTH